MEFSEGPRDGKENDSSHHLECKIKIMWCQQQPLHQSHCQLHDTISRYHEEDLNHNCCCRPKRKRLRSEQQQERPTCAAARRRNGPSLWKTALFLAILNSGTIVSQAQEFSTTKGLNLNQTLTTTEAPGTSFFSSKCMLYLALSDINRDFAISRDSEYVNFINRMSNNAFGVVSFDDLPIPLTSNFDTWAGTDGLMEIHGVYPGGRPTPEQQKRLDAICYDTVTILHELKTDKPTLPPTLTAIPSPAPSTAASRERPPMIARTFSECRTKMAVSDLTRDHALNDSEYVRFVNFMAAAENSYGYTNYQDLPDLLRFNFVILSEVSTPTGTRLIDITGSSPGDDLGAMPPEQIEFLEKICTQTQSAINTVNLFGLPTPTDPTEPSTGSTNHSAPIDISTPTSSSLPELSLPKDTPLFPLEDLSPPAPSASAGPTTIAPSTMETPNTVSFDQCRLSIALADRSRDDKLSEDEYVDMVNRLANSEQNQWDTFADLPANIQMTFYELAEQSETGNEIGVFGAAPWQSPSEEQRAFMEQVCLVTKTAIDEIPTTAPVAPPTMRPTNDVSDCKKQIAFSDTSPRDNFLERSEYVVFVNRLSKGAFFQDSFSTLPEALRENFDTLASVEFTNPEANSRNGEAIYVYGSIAFQNPDPVQVDFLSRVCEETTSAIAVAMGVPAAPIDTAPNFLSPINTPAPSYSPTTEAPEAATENPTIASIVQQPTALFSTEAPTSIPVIFVPTEPPLVIPSTPQPTTSEGEEDGGINLGAVLGGVLGGLAFIVVFCVGCYLFSASILALLACCGFDEDGNRKPIDANKTDGGDGSDRGDDSEFNGFGAPPGAPGTPKPGEDSFQNIAVADSPQRNKGDIEQGSQFDERSTKEFGQYGGPDLPIDFGIDPEEVDGYSSSSSRDKVGDGEEDDEDDDDEEEEEEEEDSFEEDDEDDGDEEPEGFDNAGGDFGGDQGNGWGQGFGGGNAGWAASPGEDDDDDASEYSEDMHDSLPERESQMDEEYSQESGEDKESVGSYEEDQEEDEENTKNSGAFGNGFGGDDFGFDGDNGFGGFDNRNGAKGAAFGQGDFFDAPLDEEDDEEEDEEDEDSFESHSDNEDNEDGEDDQSPEESLQKLSTDLDEQIDNDDWDGVVESIRSLDHDPNEVEESEGSGSEYSDEEEDPEQQAAYRKQVEKLVAKVIPDEKDNIDDMLEQFRGREGDLINTLLGMQEKNGTAGGSPEAQSQYSEGESRSSGDGESQASGSQSEYSQSEYDGSQYSGEEGESRYSGEEGESRYSGEEGESQYSGEEEGESKSSGSYSGEEGESQHSGSHGGDDQEGSYFSGSYSGSESEYDD